MKILNDIWSFIIALRFVDIVFFFAVLILMILVITLIYFININKNELKDNKHLEETAEMKIVKELKENMKKSEPTINFTNYEKDQEDKAIISYDELLHKNTNYALNYEKEEMHDDLLVKKVDLENLVSKSSVDTPSIEVRVISFAKEEAFLEALKQLQKELG